MVEQNTSEHDETKKSGLLLSVEPLTKPKAWQAAADKKDSGKEASDSVSDADGTDETDSDGADESDGDGTDGTDGDGTDSRGTDADGADATTDSDGSDS